MLHTIEHIEVSTYLNTISRPKFNLLYGSNYLVLWSTNVVCWLFILINNNHYFANWKYHNISVSVHLYVSKTSSSSFSSIEVSVYKTKDVCLLHFLEARCPELLTIAPFHFKFSIVVCTYPYTYQLVYQCKPSKDGTPEKHRRWLRWQRQRQRR